MSRIGKIPVAVPKEVKVQIDAGQVNLEGSKGKLSLRIPNGIKVEHKDDQLIVNRLSDAKQHRTDHGTVRANLTNMVKGLTEGHKKDLEIQGLGYRVQLQGKKIVFNLGLSHSIEYDVPEDLEVKVPNQTSISVAGSDIQRVGEIAAQIKRIKPAEPYKGKGIRYVGEHIRRKQGKSVTK